jgi:hypothetical protein
MHSINVPASGGARRPRFDNPRKVTMPDIPPPRLPDGRSDCEILFRGGSAVARSIADVPDDVQIAGELCRCGHRIIHGDPEPVRGCPCSCHWPTPKSPPTDTPGEPVGEYDQYAEEIIVRALRMEFDAHWRRRLTNTEGPYFRGRTAREWQEMRGHLFP